MRTLSSKGEGLASPPCVSVCVFGGWFKLTISILRFLCGFVKLFYFTSCLFTGFFDLSNSLFVWDFQRCFLVEDAASPLQTGVSIWLCLPEPGMQPIITLLPLQI